MASIKIKSSETGLHCLPKLVWDISLRFSIYEPMDNDWSQLVAWDQFEFY